MFHLYMFSVYKQHSHQHIFCDTCGSHMKVTVFWDVVIRCSLAKNVIIFFEKAAASIKVKQCLTAPWRRGHQTPLNHKYWFNKLHSVRTQKTV